MLFSKVISKILLYMKIYLLTFKLQFFKKENQFLKKKRWVIRKI